MGQYAIIQLREHPEWMSRAARWFHEKWDVPAAEYERSMAESAQCTAPVPQWYLLLCAGQIAGGVGVIENDFHDRPDLSPNVCALYIEPQHRCRGLAGALLHHVCVDLNKQGIGTLYLVTEHDAFYERYGWTFVCTVRGDDGAPMRLYRCMADRTEK